MKHPSFLIHFDKRVEDKWWLGVRLVWCDNKTVVTKVVNLVGVRFVIEKDDSLIRAQILTMSL